MKRGEEWRGNWDLVGEGEGVPSLLLLIQRLTKWLAPGILAVMPSFDWLLLKICLTFNSPLHKTERELKLSM